MEMCQNDIMDYEMEDDDESPPKNDIRTIITIDPLQIEQVLAKIFEFLDTPALTEARLVNQFWEVEARRGLFKSCHTIIHSPIDFHTRRTPVVQNELRLALTRLLSNPPILDPLRLRLTDHRDTQILQETKLLNEKIITLDYDGEGQMVPGPTGSTNGQPIGMDTEQLSKVMAKLPNLQILDTTCLNLDPTQHWLLAPVVVVPPPHEREEQNDDPNDRVQIIDIENNNNSRIELESFLEKLNSLKEIRLNFWLNLSTLANYAQFKEKLGAVNSLRINNEHVFNLYIAEIGQTWPISRVRLMINNEIPMEVIRHFLRTISNTLTHLRLSFFLRPRHDLNQVDPGGAPYGDPNFLAHLPWSLSHLRTLDIYEDDPKLESTVWKTVAIALQLSQLKTIVLRTSITVKFDEMVCQWAHHRQRRLQSQNLENLTIWPKAMTSSTILFNNFWPNLKSLVIKLEINQTTTPAAFLGIFYELTRLRRLELFLTDDHSLGRQCVALGLSPNFDKLLTGIRKPVNYVGGQILDQGRLQATQFKSIRNLQLLKSFKMECVVCCELHGWSDFFIYNGLFHLKTLQSIEMSRKFISHQAIEDLRKEFGPKNVHIHFYKDG